MTCCVNWCMIPDVLTRIKFNELSYTVNNKQVLKNIKIKRIFPEVLYFSLGSKTRKLQNIFSAQVSCLARFWKFNKYKVNIFLTIILGWSAVCGDGAEINAVGVEMFGASLAWRVPWVSRVCVFLARSFLVSLTLGTPRSSLTSFKTRSKDTALI